MTAQRDDSLARIVERRRADVAATYGRLGLWELEWIAVSGLPARDFAGALVAGDAVAVVAEVKKASPSAGPIAPDVDAAEQAQGYEAGGAAAVSVLTEPSSFGGSFTSLAAVASAVRLPVLCKDFVVDEVQVYVGRGCGSDAMLLMVGVLREQIASYLSLVRELGMQALVEVASREELDLALREGATLVGVNARDLRSLRVDRAAALALAREAKATGVTVVLASGMTGREDVEAAAAAGADAVLVGEALMRAGRPELAVRELAGVPRREVAS